MASPHQKEQALGLIDNFAARRTPGWFSHFKREDVAAGARLRVKDPTGVNQRDTWLCGPAAFLYSLADDQPYKYAQLVTQLYDDGSAMIVPDSSDWRRENLWVRPDDHLRHYQPHNRFLNAADWIAMASLRDSTNLFLDYEDSRSTGRSAGAPAGDIVQWLSTFGGYEDVVDHTRPWWTESNLHQACHYYLNGYRVLLFIDANLINEDKGDSDGPNHWVVLNSPIRIGASVVQLTVWTWGDVVWSKLNQPNKPDKVHDKARFLDHYYGFIAAKH